MGPDDTCCLLDLHISNRGLSYEKLVPNLDPNGHVGLIKVTKVTSTLGR